MYECRSQKAFGVTLAGEFSNGYNYCGLYLEGVGQPETAAPPCALFLDSSQWNETMKAGIQQFALASMDALQDWFFWTWKVSHCILLLLITCSNLSVICHFALDWAVI
jgi:glucan 1,3-beta-glucosidase